MYKKDFPFFNKQSLVYLDSAATAQKPETVINALQDFYLQENANIHRGDYKLSQDATRKFEIARETIASFIGAESDELIFTRGATEALNMVAYNLSFSLKEDEKVLVSDLEHSSNYFPFKKICERKGAIFQSVSVKCDGTLNMQDLKEKLDENIRLLSISGMSNVNGCMPDLKQIIALAHAKGCKVLVDATQLIVHHKIDVKTLKCDYLAFSGHKLYGPMGIGCLYINKESQKDFEPMLYGGGTIQNDPIHDYPLKQGIQRFEAGTQDVAGAIALKAAIDYLNEKGMDAIERYERDIASYLYSRLKENKDVDIIGYISESPLISFRLKGLSCYDAGVLLSLKNIAVRTGGHCAYPMLKALQQEDLIRVSLGIYNGKEDIDRFTDALIAISKRFKS